MLEISRAGADWARGLISGESFQLRHAALTAMRMGAASAFGLGAALEGSDDGARWVELSNKLTAYRLFASAGRHITDLGASAGEEAYSRVWTIEGVGWHLGTYWVRDGGGRHFASHNSVPEAAIIPLHTGGCLALAQAALESDRGGDARSMLARLSDMRDHFCGPDYSDLAFEALGLVTVALYPHRTHAIEDVLGETEHAAYFWHGLGRGLYFAPVGMAPLGAARRWLADQSQKLPRSIHGRENALAGLAWATTLVNIRSPEVIERCAVDLRPMTSSRAFQNGVESAVSLWLAASPGDSLPERMTRYHPRNAERAELYQTAFGEPAVAAIRRHQTYQSLPPATIFRVPRAHSN